GGDDALHVVHVVSQRGEVGEDEGERVVDFVCHSGGDLADGRQLLALRQLSHQAPVSFGVGQTDEVANARHQRPALNGLVQVFVGAGLQALQLTVRVVEFGGEKN